MKKVRWDFQGLHVPMMEDSNGNLYCTFKQLSDALQCPEATIRAMRRRRANEFSGFCVSKCNAISDIREFLEQNRIEFGLRYVRDDMAIWTEDDMIMAAVMIKNTVGKEFRKNLVKFIKENARKGYVHESEFNSRMTEMNQKIDNLAAYLNANASEAGRKLNAQKQTKHLRSIQGGAA